MNFKERRSKLINKLPDNSLFIFFNKKSYEDQNNFDVERNFYYLTGLFEYDDILVINKSNNDNYNEKLYIQRVDKVREAWTGKVIRDYEAKEIAQIEEIKYIDTFDKEIKDLILNTNNIYLIFKEDSTRDYSFEKKYSEYIKNEFNKIVLEGNSFLKELRKYKDENEIELIKKANHITKLGLENILKNLKPNMYEYQLESFFDQTIKYNGATGFAFKTICAGGINATCLHYSENNKILNDNELVLLDLGASVNTYCSDVSRTYPINGKFTDKQKLIYNIVLNGQKLIESKARAGLSTKDLNNILIKYFEKELMNINLITKPEDVKKYYFHGVSHHLGLECHDFCPYNEPLEEGAVISNEPGLYIPEWNIGIRIEDDLLITKDGCINLSKDIIKEIDEIEAYMAKHAHRS